VNIYSSDSDFYFFSTPYNAKRLLDDSVERTLKGYTDMSEGALVTGFGHILLARIESAAAFSFVALSSAMLAAAGFLIDWFVIPVVALNLISRVPGISSFESVRDFTRDSSDILYRALRIHLIGISVVVLFLFASGINTFLPGVLRPRDRIFNSIQLVVEPLGPLQTIRAIVPGVTEVDGREVDAEVDGREMEMSLLGGVEEYFRALSSQNYLREVRVAFLTHHYSYT
jgi:hypothetical protein